MNNNSSYQNLYEFIDIAEKNRKYASNTAFGLKAALRLFEQQLKAEEKINLSMLKERIEQIYQSVYAANKSKMTASTLETYKKRIIKILADFEKFGNDPNKLANWNPPTRIRKNNTLQKQQSSEIQVVEGEIQDNQRENGNSSSLKNKIELIFSENRTAVLFLPPDLNEVEAEKIKKYIDAGIS